MGGECCFIAILSKEFKGMDLVLFEKELRNAILPLKYVISVDIKRRTEISLQGIIVLDKNYRLKIFFNESFYIIAFSLIYKNKRIWSIDRDNRVGWHLHPLNNTNKHELIDEMTINQIIKEFDVIYQNIYNKIKNNE